MPSSIENVKIGVCQLSFNATDLGYTKGGVDLEVTTETHTVTVDQFGETPISDYIIGRKVSVKTPLAETTLDNLVLLMPGATKVTDGVDPLKEKVTVTTGVGANLITSANKLVLLPQLGDGTTDGTQAVTIPKASTAGSMSWSYNINEERVFDVTWMAYPDTDNGNQLFIYGDETATP